MMSCTLYAAQYQDLKRAPGGCGVGEFGEGESLDGAGVAASYTVLTG